MGAPNFKRLAELGQLPDYAKIESLSEINEKVIEKKEEERKIEEFKQKELIARAEELGLSTKGSKKDLIARIQEAEAIPEETKEETKGEFTDDILA